MKINIMQAAYAILFTLMFPTIICVEYENIANDLTKVPADIPHDATEVELSWNHITNLPSGSFSGLSKCTKLDVGYNDIRSIDSGVFPDNLEKLHLNNNELKDLPPALHKLELLYLGNNMLTTIREDMWTGLNSLKELNLDRNQISEIKAGSLQGLDSLIELDVKKNKIRTIETGAFRSLRNLEELWMYENELTEIKGDMWTGLNSLTHLFIYKNKISTIEDGAFSSLTHLEMLDLSENALTVIRKEMWQGLNSPSGLTLRLGTNQLTSVAPGMFSDLIHLDFLSLYNNQLTTLDKDVFHPAVLTRVNKYGRPGLSLDLQDNSFLCDETVCWMVEAAEDGYVKVYGPDCTNYPDVKWRDIEFDCENQLEEERAIKRILEYLLSHN